MGMKDYKFLLRSRDLIVNSEKKIGRIDKKMTEIEQKVIEIKSDKKKLLLPKSDSWEDEIDAKILHAEEELRFDTEKQESELENVRINVEKKERDDLVTFIMAIFVIPLSLYIPALIGSEDLFLFWCLGAFVLYVYLFFIKKPVKFTSEQVIIEKYDFSKQELSIKELKEKRLNYTKNFSRKRDLDEKLTEINIEFKELIKEKEELAKKIKKTWKEVSHLVPKT